MSRIIIKNIPKNTKENDLIEHFSAKGDITDVKIIKTQTGKDRLFAFVGYKSEEQAKASIKYYNNTYLKTNKILVEEAKVQGDKALNKPWSKHTKWLEGGNQSEPKDEDKNSKQKNGKNTGILEQDTKLKVQKLKEIEKVTSAKFKFDMVQGLEQAETNETQNNSSLSLREDSAEEVKKQSKDLLLLESSKAKKNNSKVKNTKKHSAEVTEQGNNKEETIKEVKEKNTSKDKQFTKQETLEDYDSRRLYIRNLSFQITEEELQQAFSRFGSVSEASVPRDKNKNSFGYGFVAFETTESAIIAMESMDKKVFQGRILHISPAKSKDIKPSLSLNDLQVTQTKKSSFKKEKLIKLKSEFDKEASWNFMFLNQNAVIDAVVKQTGVAKEDVLSKDNSKLAVEVAAMETVMINKTKEWLESQGVDLRPFNNKRLTCTRSKTILLIKNIDSTANEEDLRKVFSRFGELLQFLISPYNTIGIAEFIDAKNAENCFKNLSFYELNGLPLYLEFAPVGLKLKSTIDNDHTKASSDANSRAINKEGEMNFDQGNILFVNNLSFETKEEGLQSAFKDYNPVAVKIVKNKTKNNPNLSAGYGFIEFKTANDVELVLRKLQGTILDSHSLKLSKAKSKGNNNNDKGALETEFLQNKRKRENDYGDVALSEFKDVHDDKLLIKNLAFEVNKDELREMFKRFGDVKNVRLPLKSTGEHRGYGFAEFLSHEEAKKAFEKLANTHFYGRKLVIEWAKKEKSMEDIREETKKKLNLLSIETHKTMGKKSIN